MVNNLRLGQIHSFDAEIVCIIPNHGTTKTWRAD
jgi:hypothetical protein